MDSLRSIYNNNNKNQLSDCVLCHQTGGDLVASDAFLRVIHTPEPGIDAFYRVVWGDHVKEWSDLDEASQIHCLRIVGLVERALRDVLQPTKINIASLGNKVQHVHWHVIARFEWDAHFPNSVWTAAHTLESDLPTDQLNDIRQMLPEVESLIVKAFQKRVL